jgi:hypothetical protein
LKGQGQRQAQTALQVQASDVLDRSLMPAVDSPGIDPDDLTSMLAGGSQINVIISIRQ